AAGEGTLAVTTERQGEDVARVDLPQVDGVAPGRVPEPDVPLDVTGQHRLTVGAEGPRDHERRLLSGDEHSQGLPGGSLPPPRFPVLAPRQDRVAVAAERRGDDAPVPRNAPCLPAAVAPALARGHVPEPELLPDRGHLACRRP